ncbi:transposase [Mycetohabitans sp. B46]
MKHPLMQLTKLIDWDQLSMAMNESFVPPHGRPASLPRLIAGLLYLQYTFDLSDPEVVWQWLASATIAMHRAR